ncbi:glutaminase A [Gordonia jinhuaensis]|uniref:glutaminase A n=1 Tax=Gordonia jinhuaensis TaxID=1517702 RepID=UPI001E284A6F|nr:glutaminase A [Gordonia jinhuaensis]
MRQNVYTGVLPDWDDVERLVAQAFDRYRDRDDGAQADYIPALAEVDPNLFAIAAADVNGGVHKIGSVDVSFTIQSISKAFVYALACDRLGRDAVRDRVGVDNTGLPFDSVMAIELQKGHPRNPMVNAGALTTTSLVPGETFGEQWQLIRETLSAFAGRELQVDEQVYRSEALTNQRNRAIAQLLESYGRIDVDPLEVVDVYTRQCSLLVDVTDLAVMGATLADGGVNPVTGATVVSPDVCRDTLAALAASGMYERSGEWLFEVGIPAKSGVSGGIVAITPGKGAIATFAPPLDEAGNSVRGQLAIGYLSRTLGLNVFASAARATGRPLRERVVAAE